MTKEGQRRTGRVQIRRGTHLTAVYPAMFHCLCSCQLSSVFVAFDFFCLFCQLSLISYICISLCLFLSASSDFVCPHQFMFVPVSFIRFCLSASVYFGFCQLYQFSSVFVFFFLSFCQLSSFSLSSTCVSFSLLSTDSFFSMNR